MVENGNGAKSITAAVNKALDKAFCRAVKLHREARVPMVFCEGQKVIEKDPWDIPIPEKYADLEPFRY